MGTTKATVWYDEAEPENAGWAWRIRYPAPHYEAIPDEHSGPLESEADLDWLLAEADEVDCYSSHLQGRPDLSTDEVRRELRGRP